MEEIHNLVTGCFVHRDEYNIARLIGIWRKDHGGTRLNFYQQIWNRCLPCICCHDETYVFAENQQLFTLQDTCAALEQLHPSNTDIVIIATSSYLQVNEVKADPMHTNVVICASMGRTTGAPQVSWETSPLKVFTPIRTWYPSGERLHGNKSSTQTSLPQVPLQFYQRQQRVSIPTQVENDSEDDDGDEMTWLGYNEVSAVNSGKSFVQFERPKRTKGDLINLHTGKMQKVSGMFHLVGQWWQTTILRTKMTTRDKYKEAKDAFAMCYRLRNDANRFRHKVLPLFLSEIRNAYEYGDDFMASERDFENYLKSANQYENADPGNIEERLSAFVDSCPDEERKQIAERFKKQIVESHIFLPVQLAIKHPELLHYMSQLFPFQFKKLITVDIKKLDSMADLLDKDPGHLAFKQIVSKKCKILGLETSSEPLKKSGLMSKVPREVQDAMLIYELLKKETKENGHTCIKFDRILDILSSVVMLVEEALEFLNKNKVTKTQVEGGYRVVYLMQLWQAENRIAGGINSLISNNELNPWKLEVNWDREDLQSVCQDADQLRAAKLITDQPVVAISGKGGCGKTYVVTKVIRAAEESLGVAKNGKSSPQSDKAEETQAPGMEEEEMGDNDWLNCNHDNNEEQKVPPTIKLLLTAPTGKAANLLGKRAGCKPYTLHQVIFSHRMLKPDQPWAHKDVNILVVDECSLVSVSTFAYLIQLLIDEAQLRRIILLGDIRQLPSIEPGNFLEDTFIALSKIGCAVELRTNHRAESQIIVDNATRISTKMYPIFNKEKFVLRKLPDIDPTGPNKDYHDQDVNQEVIRLLQHPDLKSDVNSQFISFTRRICDSINDHCCNKYSNHRTMENYKRVFRKNDKICCTKNGYVNVYEDVHGFMSCKKKKVVKKAEAGSSQAASLADNTGSHSDVGLNRMLGDTAEIGTQSDNQGLTQEGNQPEENKQVRLCNGEIFFILDEVEKNDDCNTTRTFLLLSAKDPDEEYQFWVDKRQMKKTCKIRHAWARTIHTFQGSETDNVVYIVGGRSRHQNWQHVYTAITRGRKSVFILGEEGTLRAAIKRSEIKRQTSLKKQLIERFQKRNNFIGTQVPKTPQKQVHTAGVPISPQQSMMFSPSKDSPIPSTSAIPAVARGRGDNSKCRSRLSLTGRIRNGGKPSISAVSSAKSEEQQNTTQMMTDILTTLAEDHDDNIQEYESDDESPLPNTDHKMSLAGTASNAVVADLAEANMESDVDSDGSDSQSLLSNSANRDRHTNHKGISKGVSKESSQCKGNSPAKGGSAIRMINGEKTEAKADADEGSEDETGSEMSDGSDESQSLLVPPSVKKPVQTDISVSSTTIDTEGRKTSARSLSQMGFPMLARGRQSFGSVNTSNSPITPQTGSMFTRYVTPRTLQQGANSSSPITPWTGQLSSVQKTSSPLDADGHQFHIHTGVSPLTPGFGDVSSTKHSNSFLNTSYIPPTPADRNGTSEVIDHIQEPRSNDSQWSEIDESEFLKLDTSEIETNKSKQTNTSVSKGNVLAFNLINKTDAGTRQSLSRPGSRSRNVSNLSATSLWSDLGDENYLSLNLDDISNMADKYHHGNTSTTSTLAGNHSKHSSSDTTKENLSRNLNSMMEFIESPAVLPRMDITANGSAPDIAGHERPTVPNINPRHFNHQRRQPAVTSPEMLSPTTPPRPGSSSLRGLSPGIKRPHTSHQEVSPKKAHIQTDAASSISPLKRSLSKLDFNSP